MNDQAPYSIYSRSQPRALRGGTSYDRLSNRLGTYQGMQGVWVTYFPGAVELSHGNVSPKFESAFGSMQEVLERLALYPNGVVFLPYGMSLPDAIDWFHELQNPENDEEDHGPTPLRHYTWYNLGGWICKDEDRIEDTVSLFVDTSETVTGFNVCPSCLEIIQARNLTVRPVTL